MKNLLLKLRYILMRGDSQGCFVFIYNYIELHSFINC